MLKEDFKDCNKILAYYTVKITEEFLISQHDKYYYVSHKQSF